MIDPSDTAITWTADCFPVQITFSHIDDDILDEAYFRVTAQLRAKRIGATVTRIQGFWQGACETGYRVELLDADDATIQTLVRAACGGGCSAIQVEYLPRRIAEEWRSA